MNREYTEEEILKIYEPPFISVVEEQDYPRIYGYNKEIFDKAVKANSELNKLLKKKNED